MCGIVGMMGHNGGMPLDYLSIFREMIIADTLRGDDATGMVTLVGKKKLLIYKEPYDGYSFTWADKYDQLTRKHAGSHRFILGHNRAATIGKVTKDNAHPFLFSKICGVHNGTINHFGSFETDQDMKKYPVDSQQLYFLINKYGVDAALKQVFGAYALVYYDMSEKRLNFIRNHARPLWFAKTASGLFWASERGMLEWILRRNKHYNATFEELPAHELRSIKINNINDVIVKQGVGVTYTTHTQTQSNHSRLVHETSVRRSLPSADNGTPATPAAIVKQALSAAAANNNLDQRKITSAAVLDGTASRAMTKLTEKFDFTKKYKARISHTSYVGGSYTIHGCLTEDPFKQFIIMGCNAMDFRKWHGRLLAVKVRYFDKVMDRFHVNLKDVGPYLNSESESGELMVPGAGGVLLPVSEFEAQVRGGCICCNKSLAPAEADKVFWTEDEVPSPICEMCIGSWDLFMTDKKRSERKLH